jgi:uncharacterized protein YbgA (DUF1722 family)/uncharacterized protein YbbK (DUF523 family)
MKRRFELPRVVVSKCLGFAACRYNAQNILSEIVERLKPHVEFRTICPEVEIGLGVPRKPVRVLKTDAEDFRLVQPETGRDVTDSMVEFARGFLDGLDEVDGFILKSRSPSCGTRDTKIYPGPEKVAAIGRGPGFFGAGVLGRFGDLAVEDEARLTNPVIREHFLRKLFTLAEFRSVKAKHSMGALVRFQTLWKYFLMAYNQKELKALGQIVANREKLPVETVLQDYESHLLRALSRAPRYTSNINVLQHTFGHVSERLSGKERTFFVDVLDRYRQGRVPLSVPVNLMESWIARFEDEYLGGQAFFEPYPWDLVDPEEGDLRVQRDFWK